MSKELQEQIKGMTGILKDLNKIVNLSKVATKQMITDLQDEQLKRDISMLFDIANKGDSEGVTRMTTELTEKYKINPK